MTIYTDMYDTQLHSQNFMRDNLNSMVGRIWLAGHSLDTPGLKHVVQMKKEKKVSTLFKPK